MVIRIQYLEIPTGEAGISLWLHTIVDVEVRVREHMPRAPIPGECIALVFT